jgi:hypothetical protein
MMEESLTTSQLLAAASQTLIAGGYSAVPDPPNWTSSNARVFEDAYGIVAVVVYETWSDLVAQWPDAQGQLVELISEYLARPEAKAWEGYLALLTPVAAPLEARSKIAEIRYDTGRVRKLVATGDELQTLDDVKRALLPVLPLEVEAQLESGAGLLDRLPKLLAAQDIHEDLTRVVVVAFENNQTLLEQLHAARTDA